MSQAQLKKNNSFVTKNCCTILRFWTDCILHYTLELYYCIFSFQSRVDKTNWVYITKVGYCQNKPEPVEHKEIFSCGRCALAAWLSGPRWKVCWLPFGRLWIGVLDSGWKTRREIARTCPQLGSSLSPWWKERLARRDAQLPRSPLSSEEGAEVTQWPQHPIRQGAGLKLAWSTQGWLWYGCCLVKALKVVKSFLSVKENMLSLSFFYYFSSCICTAASWGPQC